MVNNTKNQTFNSLGAGKGDHDVAGFLQALLDELNPELPGSPQKWDVSKIASIIVRHFKKLDDFVQRQDTISLDDAEQIAACYDFMAAAIPEVERRLRNIIDDASDTDEVANVSAQAYSDLEKLPEISGSLEDYMGRIAKKIPEKGSQRSLFSASREHVDPAQRTGQVRYGLLLG